MINFNGKVELSTKYVYQLLISNLRYGYTRNNHLMPSTAYEQTKEIMADFFDVDEEYALHTLQQLCEECISDEICIRFYNGVDDECGNRAEAIKFVNWCLETINKYDPNWKPYNFDLFENNVAKDDLNLYYVTVIKGDTKFSSGMTSKNKLYDFIAENILDNAKTCTYTKERLNPTGDEFTEGFKFHFKEPKEIDVQVLRFKE